MLFELIILIVSSHIIVFSFYLQFQPLSLKQGQLTDTEQSRNSTEPSEDEVHISQYTLTQRERILKNSITSK